jgi:hypothetical protein
MNTLIVRMGKSGTESALIDALNRYGNSMMATIFANSGNQQLETAADKWARLHGGFFHRSPGNPIYIRWGSSG